MLNKLKKRFPKAYDYYVHLRNRSTIRKSKRMQKMTLDEKMLMLSEVYERKFGRPLNWESPQAYTEKMQCEKLFHNSPIKSELADKYLVRKWVEEKIGKEYLIPLIGAWDSFDQIDFSSLPNQFVLKTNHGNSTNIIVKDKTSFDYKKARLLMNDWMAMDFAYTTFFEMHYSGIKRKIIAEQYVETEYGELQDYKFLCFDGVPYYCWVDMGRYSNHTRNVYDLNWELQPWNQAEYSIYKQPIPRPKNFEKMIELAKILSKGFSHVRVDLYNVNGTIYFGEMTFTNGSGLDPIHPDKYDFELGKLWNYER